MLDGGSAKINFALSGSARQPLRDAWSYQHFLHERAIVLGSTLDESTHENYSSALNSYIAFCERHGRAVDPSEETVSFYIVYMSHYIKVDSVATYLSGIVSKLEPYFPNIRQVHASRIVCDTLRGCMRLYGSPSNRKAPLTIKDLDDIINHFTPNPHYDDLLFLAMLLTGFCGLLRLGEMICPDNPRLFSWRKVTKRSSTSFSNNSYSFLLPAHKADPYFEGNVIIIPKTFLQGKPWLAFRAFLSARDAKHPASSPLWLTSGGQMPTRSFFINRLCRVLGKEYAGQSMRAGGATALAQARTPSSSIKQMGRWSSSAFEVYIRRHPVLMHAILDGDVLQRDVDPF